MQNFQDGKVPVADNKISSLVRYAEQVLAGKYSHPELTEIIRWLVEDIIGFTQGEVTLNPDLLVNQSNLIHFCNAIEKLAKGMPVQYVLGEVKFMGYRLEVNSSVLIPRPETEELVDLIIKENQQASTLKVLDLGTGSGCIAISLRGKLNDAQVTGMDVSCEALVLASNNALQNGITGIEWLEMDMLEEDLLDQREFDIMVSNPPYIAQKEKEQMSENVLNYEPHKALFVPNDDPIIFYRKIAELAKVHLHQNGIIYLEINESLAEETANIFRNDAQNKVMVMKDMFGKNRFIKIIHS